MVPIDTQTEHDMNKHLEDACEGVDAAVFTGDALHTDLAALKEYVGRWQRAIEEHEKSEATFNPGERVRANQTSGFHRGAKGTVSYQEPHGGKVWVRRDGASADCFFMPGELAREI